jgi:hypothetical protein
MAHPQSSPRGLFAKKGMIFGNSTSTVTANTTGMVVSGALYLSGQGAVGKLSANSTTILLPSTGFQMAALTTLKITSNSTGVKIGAKYISGNSTGNTTT